MLGGTSGWHGKQRYHKVYSNSVYRLLRRLNGLKIIKWQLIILTLGSALVALLDIGLDLVSLPLYMHSIKCYSYIITIKVVLIIMRAS